MSRKSFFEPPTPPTTPKIDPKILPSIYRKRRNASPEKPPDDSKDLDGLDPKTCEIFTKFLTSQGLPLEAIKENSFRIVFNYLNATKVIPTPAILEKYMENMGNPKKYSHALSKATGPLSVTIDVIEKENGDNYLTFSIHFFEGFEERKCLINLKKTIEAESILTAVCRAISIHKYDKIKISNFVVPNKRIFENFKSDVIKHQSISFHHYLGKFAESILQIEVFAHGIAQLREFVSHVKAVPDLYCKFRRIQLAEDEILDIPNMDDQSLWYSTAVFLTKCLILHPKFNKLSECWSLSYISEGTFNRLALLYQVLQRCIRHARDLSGEENSISQVIPTVLSIRNYIFDNLSHGYTFETDIREAFYGTFQELLCSRRNAMATFLDPRFAYNEFIHHKDTWLVIEKAVIEEIVDKPGFQSNREFVNSTREAKIQKVEEELGKYRRKCKTMALRPTENESPFQWWNSQKDNLENLVLIAREYLACPAVSIDAQQFFGSGGKFSNLVEIYDSEKLEFYLNCAAHYQQFDGPLIEKISSKEITELNLSIAKRLCLLKPSEPKVVVNIKVAGKSSFPPSEAPEAHPENVRLDSIVPMDDEIKLEPLDEGYALVEKDQKSIGHPEAEKDPKPKIKWAFGQPMSILKSLKSTEGSSNNNEPAEKKTEHLNTWTPPFQRCTDPRTVRIGTTMRKCFLCERAFPTEQLKYVTIDNEKLFILLGGVLGNRLKIIPACAKYFRTSVYSYYCWSHFQDSCLEIFKELGVDGPEEIIDCMAEEFENILYLIKMIRKLPARVDQARIILAALTDRYYMRPKTESIPQINPRKASPTDDHYPIFEPLIIPKEERVPRKQVLQNDVEKTVKITKTAPFKLPDFSKKPGRPAKMMVNCCFCLLSTSRKYLTRVHISKERLQIWTEKFGWDLVKRLDVPGINYMCKSHFSPTAFGRRGRLLKGMMPEIDLVKSEVTYQIDGDKFMKIDSEDVDAPTTSKPRGRPESVEYLDEPSGNESSEHSEYTTEEDPSRRRGKLEKYPKPEDVDDDSEDEKVCRFCSETIDKTEALKGVKNLIRLTEWNKVDSVKNLDYKSDNYVCKKHIKKGSLETSTSFSLEP